MRWYAESVARQGFAAKPLACLESYIYFVKMVCRKPIPLLAYTMEKVERRSKAGGVLPLPR